MTASSLTLEARGVTTGYGRLAILHDVTLGVPTGSIVGLLGANGAGKSTLLKACAGLLRPWRGSIAVEGQSVVGWSPWRVARQGVSYVAEAGGFFSELSVEENLALGCPKRRAESTAAWDEVADIFPILWERRRQRAGSLSGGEKRMLALGRAMLTQPRLLLLDEPSFGLAPIVIDQLYDALESLRKGRDLAMLIVEQYAERILPVADYVWVLTRGRVSYSGPAGELGLEHLEGAYLGGGRQPAVAT